MASHDHRWRNGLALGLAVGICLTLLIAIAFSGRGQIIHPESDAKNETEKHEEQADEESHILPGLQEYGIHVTPSDTLAQWIMALLGLVATGLSAWAVVLLKRTLHETEAAVEVTRDVGQSQLRAYVSVSFAQFVRAGDSAVAKIGIKNFGQTPAFNVVTWVHTWIERYPLEIELPRPEPKDFESFSRANLPPQTEVEHIQHHPKDINDFSRKEIQAGRAAFYVYGEVQYDDVFGVRRHTRYLYSCRDIDGQGRSGFRPYRYGNEES